MPKLKLFLASASVILLSACSTLTGKSNESKAALSPEAFEEIEMKTAALELENERLKSENARLANQLLALQRSERSKAEADAAETAADEAPSATEAKQEAPPKPAPVAAAPDADEVVVAETEAPELRGSEVLIEDAPRLVQPTFSSDETVFENEAVGEIETASVLFGVHLASYRQMSEARDGWRQLQRENPDELGLLEPRIERVNLPDKGVFLRLIGGGFSSEERAAALCVNLKDKGLFCSVSGFQGERLSLAETGG